jgi:hypothetical protein
LCALLPSPHPVTGGSQSLGKDRQPSWAERHTHRAHTHQLAAHAAPRTKNQEPALIQGEGVLHDVALLQEAVGKATGLLMALAVAMVLTAQQWQQDIPGACTPA